MQLDPESDTPFHHSVPSNKNWDVISLSLVLNFVPEPYERGRMLQLAHTLLAPGGLLFVVVSITEERPHNSPFSDAKSDPVVATSLPAQFAVSHQ